MSTFNNQHSIPVAVIFQVNNPVKKILSHRVLVVEY